MAITEPHTPVDEASKKAGYELSDAPASPVAVAIAALIVLMVMGFIGGELFRYVFEATEVKSRPQPNLELVQREQVEGPLLQAHPEVELEGYLARQQRKLQSYAWVDEANDRVRIPIERAIQLVARDGFPTWEVVNAKLPVPVLEGPPPPEAVEAIESEEMGSPQ